MIYGPNDYGDGFVTLDETRAKITKFDEDGWFDEADRLEHYLACRVAARDEMLRISDEDWMRDEGWWEVREWTEYGFDTDVRGYIWHPPTNGGWVMVPAAWMRGVAPVNTPHEPGEWDVDFSFGDDKPDGEGWQPLYAAASSAPVEG